ncbi:MAG: preprotein translocase subunit SecE [Clostridia bacterium]|nr:preprotein translocase subunit SecE [Clostridia bacterium]
MDKNKPNQKTKKKEKKPGKIGAFLKETKSEIKKVTWPTFAKVVAQTGVVLAVVVVFMLVLFGIDSGLGALLKLITG